MVTTPARRLQASILALWFAALAFWPGLAMSAPVGNAVATAEAGGQHCAAVLLDFHAHHHFDAADIACGPASEHRHSSGQREPRHLPCDRCCDLCCVVCVATCGAALGRPVAFLPPLAPAPLLRATPRPAEERVTVQKPYPISPLPLGPPVRLA